MKKFPFTNNTD